MNIDGIRYKVVESEHTDPYERCAALRPGEAVRYYDKYMYCTITGERRACYADDPNNNWAV